MPIEESKKQNVIGNITALLRQWKLAGSVDMQRMQMAFSMVLDNVDAGQPIELQSLYDYLTKEAKLDERAVIELCVVLKAREQKLGIEFELPAKVKVLSAEATEKILDKFNARADKAPGWDKKDGPAPASTGPGQQWAPTKGKKGAPPSSTTKPLIALMVTSLIGAFAYYGWSMSEREPPVAEVPTLKDPNGLPCLTVKSNGKAGFCSIAKELWDKEGDRLRPRAEITKRELGVNELFVTINPTGKVRIKL